MSGLQSVPSLYDVAAPKKRDKKGVRFLAFFGGEPSPKLLDERGNKIKFELDTVARTAIDVKAKGGDPTELTQDHARLVDRLAEIDASTDKPKVKYAQMGVLKQQARAASANAQTRGPLLIEDGVAAREDAERAAKELAKRVAGERKKVEDALPEIKALIDGAPGPLPLYTGMYDNAVLHAQAARDTGDDSAAASLWRMLVMSTSSMLTDVPLAAACIEPAKVTDFWLGKLKAAVDALPPKLAGGAKALGDLQDLKDLANKGKVTKRLDYLVEITNRATTLLEPVRRDEVAAGLPATEPEKGAALDALATSLKGNEDLEAQLTMRAAISLRFGVEFATSDEFANPLGAGIKKLGALYDVMALVPAAHLMAKKGTMQISYKEAVPGVDERPNKFARRALNGEEDAVSTIVMTLPTDGEKINKKNAAGDVTEVEFFQSTALHEIGHAVDDTQGYMAKHQAQPDHGGWAPSSLDEAKDKYATAIAAYPGLKDVDRADIEAFVAACLTGKVPPKPTDASGPHGALLPAWAFVSGAGATMAGVLESAAIWYKGADATKTASPDGKRIYFEAYGTKWWSFDLAARKNSVAEYQWRAPGEWFAEAYSLFYLGKLPPSHPVAVWCETQKAA